ncbi:hypothetical protein GCK72_019816 [Caenorhabditis remanei]|uniref:Uncharacterized protein n=1 Tax=Caenorhabditis remanei TaxID=31234 RepID=E3LJ73_CAERE|nr:hypothetical protein GCK72_019816 [Caenorhabditis remanei]EFO94887.1 hypothetical protein CRE_08652 [Caenorhabditis remanei]KAF1753260.1 hypothetical protein GCK72_019816 [Caenorhabditis remanei]
MPFSSDSMYANAGLYRQTLHDMLYTPRTEQKKKSFEDETISGVGKVSKLLNKFETGQLDLTVEESVLEQDSEEWDLDESIFEDPVFVSNEQPPVPKPRTILFTSTPKSSPEKKKVPVRPLVETPILRQLHRKAGGYDNLRNKFDQMNLDYRTPEVPRQKVNSIGSTCSSIGSSTSSSTFSTSRSGFSSNETNHKLSFSRETKEEVHKKFNKYFEWGAEMLRTIAIHVSEIRLDALSKFSETEQTEDVKCMKRIYEGCKKGTNKEMDALCCALFDLLEDKVNRKELSIHEEYVVCKYNKRI